MRSDRCFVPGKKRSTQKKNKNQRRFIGKKTIKLESSFPLPFSLSPGMGNKVKLEMWEPGVPSKTIIFVGQGRNWFVISLCKMLTPKYMVEKKEQGEERKLCKTIFSCFGCQRK